MLALSWTALFVITILSVVVYSRLSGRAAGKLPPGPRGLPIVGNVFQLPTEHTSTYFRVLCKQYGGLVKLNLLGTTVIIVGDGKLAKEMMDKRSAKYSGRPAEPYMNKYVDPDEKYWGFSDPGTTFRLGRKLTTQVMSSVRAGKSEALQRFEAMQTLQHMLDDSKGWYHFIDRYAVSAIISAMFGVRFETGEEPVMEEIVKLNDEFGLSMSITASIINMFPFLDWIPGPMPWRKRGAKFRVKEKEIYGHLAGDAIEGSKSSMDTWAQSFAGKDNDLGDHRGLLNLFVIAAAHSTATTLQNTMLAAMCYPAWVKKAQAELDAVVGQDRLPQFSDREKMPYIGAVCREVVRWRPVARSAVPHKATEDDIIDYNGQQYYIPKGATIMGVTWIIEHDPTVYPDPDTFKPERWIDANGNLTEDYSTTAFGWGRRACPGYPFAERSLWINLVLWLWTFELNRVPGHKYVSDDSAFQPDFGAAPKEFPALLVPRSVKHESVARQEWQELEKDLATILPTKRRS